ncbi:MAG: hypothetical protein KGI98_15510 [Euryarchaeota archaeon]|nr:hypothetical protein [Euryarchaeota archaeon]
MTTVPVQPPVHSDVVASFSSLARGATVVKFAVAYFTAKGARMMDPLLHEVERTEGSFGVVSVEWPTDIDELARLHKRLRGKLFIHTGIWPGTGTKVAGKLHCKVIYAEQGESTTIQVGSHNWTGTALDGSNIELSVRHECPTSGPFAKSVSEFIDTAKLLSEPFDPAKADYYKELQRFMVPPDLPHFFEFDSGFVESGEYITVVHASKEAGVTLAASSRIYLELGLDRDVFFPKNRPVHLYVHDPAPAGTESVRLFTGVVTNQNNTEHHTRNPDTLRPYPECTTMLVDWDPPRVRSKSDPSTAGRRPPAQAVVRLDADLKGERYQYHLGENRPRTTFEPRLVPAAQVLGADRLRAVAPKLLRDEIRVPLGIMVITAPTLDRRSDLGEEGTRAHVSLANDLAPQGQHGLFDHFVEPRYREAGNPFQSRFFSRYRRDQPPSDST